MLARHNWSKRCKISICWDECFMSHPNGFWYLYQLVTAHCPSCICWLLKWIFNLNISRKVLKERERETVTKVQKSSHIYRVSATSVTYKLLFFFPVKYHNFQNDVILILHWQGWRFLHGPLMWTATISCSNLTNNLLSLTWHNETPIYQFQF